MELVLTSDRFAQPLPQLGMQIRPTKMPKATTQTPARVRTASLDHQAESLDLVSVSSMCDIGKALVLIVTHKRKSKYIYD